MRLAALVTPENLAAARLYAEQGVRCIDESEPLASYPPVRGQTMQRQPGSLDET